MSLTTAEAAQVTRIDGLTVVSLSGTPYEMGFQHGHALRTEVHTAVDSVLGYFRAYLKVPWIRAWLLNWWLDYGWWQARPFVSADDREELRGLAEGAGVPLQDIYRLHAIPDRTYCANFAAWGRATAQGRLIHLRNLDWNIDAGIQRVPVVFVVRPPGKHAFLNIGWAGFMGVLTGINDAQMSIGQIGARTVDATMRGEPMALLMRRVLETSADLDEVIDVVQSAERTVGVNYVIADSKEPRGIAIETTQHHARVFEADDPAEHAVRYARPIPDVVFRADAAMDPTIRNTQRASNGNPVIPGLENPEGSTSYDVQSVIFAWPDIWIANAQGTTPAAKTSYHRLDAAQLLGQHDQEKK